MKGKDSLEGYKSTNPYPPLEKDSAKIEPEKKEYFAATETKRSQKATRFKIIMANGSSYGCSYPHLISWVLTPPSELIITTTSCIYALEGRNLGKIETLLLDEKIRELSVYDEKIHLPVENDKPKITSIKIIDDADA